MAKISFSRSKFAPRNSALLHIRADTCCCRPKPVPGHAAREPPNIKAFLAQLGLSKYLSLFVKEEIDFETLRTMSDQDLKTVGLTLFGPRRKILAALEQWRPSGAGDDVAQDLASLKV